MASLTFPDFFAQATGGTAPFPYQERLATAPSLPALIDVPTGAGKTYAIALAWAWRRLAHPDPAIRAATPRRLVYCLPMRNLVHQTAQVIQKAFDRLPCKIETHILLGGEIDDQWLRSPEQEAVLIGTQDLLLSRALMRGYAMPRSRWPVAYALLHNDALWVMDEVQLMGAALPTSAQLQAFREQMGHLGAVQTVWLSATLQPDWVKTVDHTAAAEPFQLTEADRSHGRLRPRLEAPKQLRQCPYTEKGYEMEIARLLKEEHRPGTLSLVILNTVERAAALSRALHKAGTGPVLLLHSRFRGEEREQQVKRLNQMKDGVIVATQVVEAGVDLDARLLITELAPWPSLVQRFGRCNRRGEQPDAAIYWLDLEEKNSRPYDPLDLAAARQRLQRLEQTSAAPANLPPIEMDRPETEILRRRDLLALFDTTPDLSGNDIDVGRFIRDTAELDLHLFWRDLPDGKPSAAMQAPIRNELCPVAISAARDALKKRKCWIWNPLTESWHPPSPSQIRPGITLLLDAAEGGYTPETGWDPQSTRPVPPVPLPPDVPLLESTRDDAGQPELLASHTDKVVAELERLLSALPFLAPYADDLRLAARWHDAGKAHDQFQATMRNGLPSGAPEGIWAKTKGSHRHARPHFRHELGSALALLQHGGGFLPAYLAAAHHGYVRLSIRSLPGEQQPAVAGTRYALGIHEGDPPLREADLGGGVILPETVLDLSPMEMGAPLSWTAAALALRDDPGLGPFRLAFLEAALRVADWRGSANQGKEEPGE